MSDIKAIALAETYVTTLTSTNSFIHTNKGIFGGSNDRFVLTGNVDHVIFEL